VAPTNLSISIAKSTKLLDLRGDYNRAASILMESLDSPEATNHPEETLEALALLSEIQLCQGNSTSALLTAQRAIQMETQVGTTGQTSPHIGTARRVLIACRGKMSERNDTKK